MSTVMVCDDSPLARETMRRNVATVPGVTRVLAAASGEEALARWPVERPSLVLMDVRMPGLGGTESARRLLALHPEANVIMVTVAEDADGVARAVTAGARGYVVKDASREEPRRHRRAVAHRRAGPTCPRRGRRAVRRCRPHAHRARAAGHERHEPRSLQRRDRQGACTCPRTPSRPTPAGSSARLGAADRAQAVAVGFRWGLVR
ncbi:DNA-binding response regulator [Angustibacter aerolatus]|uniref:DNA-binding response regulator n=1 Tax=Angustibacter aerolatus TaxID=1162965 RepID=A0ABQ6JN53_9ACTN|nr:DNA-binding response regulator [Angustibacter aerolatus]